MKQQNQKINIVPQFAVQQPDVNQGLIMRGVLVLFVIDYFKQINTIKQNTAQKNAGQKVHGGVFVKSINRVNNSDVYCLTVPQIGCFALANGVIVSNCDASTYPIVYERPIKRKYAGEVISLAGYY